MSDMHEHSAQTTGVSAGHTARTRITDTVRRRVGALGGFEFYSFLGTEMVSMTNDIGPRPVTSELQSRQEGEGFARVAPWK